MAIPFAFPSDDETETNLQLLDQLITDLIPLLHQILVTQRRIRNAQQITRNRVVQHGGPRRATEVSQGSQQLSPVQNAPGPSGLFIPDAQLVSSLARSVALETMTQAAQPMATLAAVGQPASGTQPGSAEVIGGCPSRRRRRRRRNSSESSCCEEVKPGPGPETVPDTTQDWTQVGVNLRQIADDFHDSVDKSDDQVDESKRPCTVEASTGDASLLSMLVPPPFSSSIWTAVIFVVGWRLLARAR